MLKTLAVLLLFFTCCAGLAELREFHRRLSFLHDKLLHDASQSIVQDPLCKSPIGLCYYDARTGLFIPPPSFTPFVGFVAETEVLFTEGVLRDELATFTPPSHYTAEHPLIIHNSIGSDFFSPLAIPGTQTSPQGNSLCPAHAFHCILLSDVRVPTLVISSFSPVDADVQLYLSCSDPKTPVSRPFNRSGQPYTAEFLAEPSYRSLSCRQAGAPHPAHFLLAFLPGADIFLPPWQAHVPFPWDKFLFDEYQTLRPFRILTWEEKVALARPGAVDGQDSHGSLRLSVYISHNCDPNIKRTKWLRAMMDASDLLVDSTSACLHNAQPPQHILSWKWNPSLGPTYGWEQLYIKYAQKAMMIADYFFHLAFENIIDDPLSMTEKFIGAFVSGTVPVLMGPTKWMIKFLPLPHSAIFSDSFRSPQDLAQFLRDLAANKTAYEQYLSWRQVPIQELNPNFLSMFDISRRYRVLSTLSSLAAYTDENPKLAENHRIFVNQVGFVPQDRVNLIKNH